MVEPPALIWRVNRKPRFPLLSLGEYLAAEDSQRETMRRNMKYERIAPTLLYRKLQLAVGQYLSSPLRDRRILDRCKQDLEAERERAKTPTAADNATYAIRALETFERSLNSLSVGGFVLERPPLFRPTLIESVKLSIQPTALITVNRPRGKTLKGAIVVDTAKGVEPKTPEAKLKAIRGMTHAAYLLHEHVASLINTTDHKSSPEHCLIFHSYRAELVPSPQNYKKDLENTKAACRTVAELWDRIDPPPSFDPSKARYRD
jgi:hypothetical protein